MNKIYQKMTFFKKTPVKSVLSGFIDNVILRGCNSEPHPFFVHRAGFTLIELLVVVLIIGILAAIALPQYTKAVAKSRFAEVMINLKALSNAVKICEMETGTSVDANTLVPCSNLSNLAISLPCESGRGDEHNCYVGDFRYQATDVNGNGKANALYLKEDVCLCMEEDGELVLNQTYDRCTNSEASLDYAKLLNITEVDLSRCSCC